MSGIAKGTWVDKHSQNILRSLESDVFTIIGRKQTKDVTRQDIIAVLVKIEDREAYDVAKRVYPTTSYIIQGRTYSVRLPP